MAENKLVGQNYETPDLRAKVTGRARYAEDFRAQGMLFARLLSEPVLARASPQHRHERRARDARRESDPAARRRAGSEGSGQRRGPDDARQPVAARRRSTNEPLYQGEPVLAVAAVDELTAAEAIEKIKIRWERLPFNVDPVATLLPGATTARVEGNVWVRPTPTPGQPPPLPEIKDLKWTEREFAEYNEGRLPMGEDTDPAWSYGDVEAGFKKAALVLDETFVTPNTSHQCLESRSSMAYWQNGKLHIHLSTQSTVQTVMSVARWLSLEPENIVLIGEYCGGGYGSKATGSVTDIIPALLAKKTGTPVQMRISREEEHAVGGARPAFHGRMKVGFTKEGRITAIDMFTVVEGGPYGPGGDGNSASRFASLMFQPEAMRWRGVTAITNTPPRRAQSQPGGMQGIVSAWSRSSPRRRASSASIRSRSGRSTRRRAKRKFGPAECAGQPHVHDELLPQRSARQGRARSSSGTSGRPGAGSARARKCAASAWRSARYVAGSVGFDGLFVIKPDGRMYIQTGIGNLGTESMVGLPARRRRNDGHAVGKDATSPGATRRRTCRGAACRAAARRFTRIRARRTPRRATPSRSCSRSRRRISAAGPRTTSWPTSASRARAAAPA